MPTLPTPNAATRYYRVALSTGIYFFRQDAYIINGAPVWETNQITEEEFYADTATNDNTPALDAGAESARKTERPE